MTQLIKQFWKDEEGVTAIEYGLIAALVAIVIVAAVRLAGTNLNTMWVKIKDCLVFANGGAQGTCP